MGFGRIEVFTKPGTDKFRGNVFFNYGNDIFNSRNPYAAQKAPFDLKEYGGTLSGPLGKRASFFLDVDRRAIDNGVTHDELKEVITHLAFYSGWPTAMSAIVTATGMRRIRPGSACMLERGAAPVPREEAVPPVSIVAQLSAQTPSRSSYLHRPRCRSARRYQARSWRSSPTSTRR